MHVLYAETEFILNSCYTGRVKETQVKGKKKKKDGFVTCYIFRMR